MGGARVCGGVSRAAPLSQSAPRACAGRGRGGAAAGAERERGTGAAEMERPSGLGLAALGALGRRLLWALPAYAAGLLGLGAGAVVLALALYAGWRRRRRARERGMRAAERLHREEEAAVRAAARGELPAWVSFPDVERAEWLNKVLAQAWPFLGQYLEKLLQDSVAPAIRASSAHLQSFAFTRVDLGQKPLRVLGVQAHPGTHQKQILLDLNISYVGDVQIDVEVKKFFCKAGVKGMQLHGVLRVILEPLLGEAPIVGALSVFFIRRPTLDINWTGMTNLLDIPGLSSMSDSMIMDSIASYLVLPNRLLLPLLPDLPEAARLRWPLPRGVVRVSLVAAIGSFLGGLVQGRWFRTVRGRVEGTQTATSRVIGDSLDPVWDEMYEFMVHEVPGQELEVELFDKDPDKDDLLGRMKLDLGEVLRARVMDEWFPLQEGGQGRLHLRLEWLSLLSDASKLDQVLEKNQKIVAKPDPPSSAILVVYLDRAEGLPVRKAGKEPNPVVQVSVQDVTRESKVVCNTSAPVWEDAFRFFLHDPSNQDVDFQVKDDPRQSPLGSLSLPLSRLLQSPSLSLAEPFPLQRSGPGALLHLQLELRVLFPEPPEPGGAPPGQAEPPKSDTEGPPPRPSRAGPDPRSGTERVLRVQLLEAAALVAKDQRLGGLVRGRSDPYAEVRAGGSRFRSRVVRDELNPRWNESYEVIVDDVPGQDVEFDLFDKDIDKDDFLGRCKVPLRRVLSSRVVDEWLPLQDVPSGRLHVRLESLEPRPSAELLDRVLHTNALLQPQHGPELSAALLRVYLDRAADLPLRKGSAAAPRLCQPGRGRRLLQNPGGAGWGSGGGSRGSCPPCTEPVWDEGFSFLIRRPHAETLELQVRAEAGPPLGSLSLPLAAQLLPRAGLSMDGWVPLPGGGQLLLRAQLGVLVSQEVEEGAARRAPEGGDPERPQEEEEEEQRGEEDEQRGAGGLRQRQVPADRRPQPPQGPRVLLSLRLHREQRRLVAIVHSCRDLRAASKEPPDPYVSLALLPERGRGGSKRKTGVQRRTLNPEFNERFEWELPPEEAPRRRLEATVKSSGNFVTGGKEALGKLQLELAQVDLSEGDPRWYELQDERSLP
ncbi:extended synaptotagmin-1 [Camarhynchus parvulus]|uniref:extended synaptotagmin-1 n=1 Tax=Geospiza parvula TaxID=87175 RepID=UPI0012381140|nr:extended synaptotagmin-1 [Camarhynchus parvulus]